jgi:auxin influx carrier (AUX1 LAX family)
LFVSEIMHAMWKPAKFKYIYLLATLYVFTLTLPSAAAMYWAFGDELLTHSNAFSLLPKTRWRDAAVILMLIHQFITFGFACTPLYFVWEKVIGMHDAKSIFKRALARLPIVVPIWFLAIIFPFFGPINSAVGALLVSFTVYIIPALAHVLTYRTASARMVRIHMHACICIALHPRRLANNNNGVLWPGRPSRCLMPTGSGTSK